MPKVARNSEEHGLILTALTAMAIRHTEWGKLESNKRNCDHSKVQYHQKMHDKYDQLREKLSNGNQDSTTCAASATWQCPACHCYTNNSTNCDHCGSPRPLPKRDT